MVEEMPVWRPICNPTVFTFLQRRLFKASVQAEQLQCKSGRSITPTRSAMGTVVQPTWKHSSQKQHWMGASSALRAAEHEEQIAAILNEWLIDAGYGVDGLCAGKVSRFSP